ncbi:hypothetical protein WA026_019369 [Henosepilachna vigintioctopunctata]|uniref:Uncharacterized protein n=1 Tax=Henosepilachna vigintioctopunctata TaxID=420089 RepID=A0AAW1U5B9_9CUCU
MNQIIIMIFCSLLSAVMCSPAELYSAKWDNIDIDEILKSDRLLEKYFVCLMKGEPCPPEGADLRKYLPDAIATSCAKCTDKQKENSKRIIIFLMKNKPDKWKLLEAKFDPKMSYRQNHKKELEMAGIVV